MPEGWDYSGSIRKPKNHLVVHPWCKFEKEIIVKTKRLDTWCKEKEIDRIDLCGWMFRVQKSMLSKGGEML